MLQVLHGGLLAGEQRIGEGLAEIGNQPVAIVLREAGDIEGKLRGERQQDLRGHMPLVRFQLRQVAHRDPKLSCQTRLCQSRLGADIAELAADEELFRAHDVHNFAICRFLI
jgi:hypothetical protein